MAGRQATYANSNCRPRAEIPQKRFFDEPQGWRRYSNSSKPSTSNLANDPRVRRRGNRLARHRLQLAFIVLIAGLESLAPSASVGQQPTYVPRIGFLRAEAPDLLFDAFRDGLRTLGYIDGHNVVIEQRWAYGYLDRLPNLAQELVRLKVDIIVTASTPATLAAKRATTTIPIVIAASGDPVASGLVASLAHPGGKRHWQHSYDRGDCHQAAGTTKGGRAESLARRCALECVKSGVCRHSQTNRTGCATRVKSSAVSVWIWPASGPLTAS
jgi:hypothetical protein